ncbi:hypothetical protein NEOLEDRAFT_1140103 [Neolentinus lepideus HHB14362 ss-1]|uniref:Uncharacterized protein n=1 Tax=Neolentinus lepideus HHB14362 ss-1 TaxID=1314782 RepID=A0A165PEM1_9AGAM|nr:hypothetical protein NEOLEDRAFT_1140103 [Neolentinus lepideus HHB14362 ss-1]
MQFWRDPENIVLHAVDSATAWPNKTMSLIEPLRKPLPEWVYYGPHPFTSRHCRSLAAELKQQRPVIALGDPPSTVQDQPSNNTLRLCFDMALCTTALLRSLMLTESEMTKDPVSKTSILANFVRNIMLLGVPDAVPLDEAEYVLPRHPKFPHNPLFKFTHKTAVAPLIICNSPVEPSNGYSAHWHSSSTSPDSWDTPSSGRAHSISTEAPRGSPEFLSDTSLGSGSAGDPEHLLHPGEKAVPRRWQPWELDVPGRLFEDFACEDDPEESDDDFTAVQQETSLNRHLLSSASSSDKALLPFLCMSQGEDVFGLLASVLYQRYAWGIKEPIPGLTYRRGSTTLQLVVAWLEECDTPDGHLPQVHVAFEDSSSHPVSLGQFNLCDPIGAFRLASFLGSLRNHAQRLQDLVLEVLADPPCDPLIWRSDFNREEENSDSYEHLPSRIAEWANGVAEALQGPDNHRSNSIQVSMATDKPNPRWKGGRANDSRSLPAMHLEGGDQVRTIAHNATAAKSKRGIALGSPSEAPSKAQSCSAFAKGTGQDVGAYGDLHICHWMADRLALLSGFVGQTSSEAINRYEDYTAFRWPNAWDSLDKMPSVDPLVEDLKEELFLAVQERQGKADTPSHKDILSQDPLYHVMSSKLSVVLHACRNARLRRQYGQGTPIIYEVDTRRDWDNLLGEFIKSEKVFPLPERLLHLPKNSSVENDYSTQFVQLFTQLYRKEDRILGDGADDRDGEQATHIWSYVSRLRTVGEQWVAWQSNNKGMTLYSQKAEVRSVREPSRGKCDQVCALRCPDFYPKKSNVLRDMHRLIIQGDPTDTDEQEPHDIQGLSQTHRPAPIQRTQAVLQTIFGSSRNEALLLSQSDTVDDIASRVANMGIIESNSADKAEDDDKQAAKWDRSLYVPLLLVEYKKADGTPGGGVNQARMYTVAGSKFLAHLGIYDFPTFGLVTDGALGAVTCTYTLEPGRSHKPKLASTRVCEANARIFDICHPLSAFHFCTFLTMLLTSHADKLEKLLGDDCRSEFQEKCKTNDPSLQWNMKMQRKARSAVASSSGSAT